MRSSAVIPFLGSPLFWIIVLIIVLRVVMRSTWRSALLTTFIFIVCRWLLVVSAHLVAPDNITRLTLHLLLLPPLSFLMLRWRNPSTLPRLATGTFCVVAPLLVSLIHALGSELLLVPVSGCPEGQLLSGAAFPAAQQVGCMDASGQKQGRWMFWHPSGSKLLCANYRDGKPEGNFVWWHENGQKFQEGAYTNGHQSGAWSTWTKEGHVRWEGTYSESGDLNSGESNYPVALP